jgi:hypothetical protein
MVWAVVPWGALLPQDFMMAAEVMDVAERVWGADAGGYGAIGNRI